jgi:hypothetical protein
MANPAEPNAAVRRFVMGWNEGLGFDSRAWRSYLPPEIPAEEREAEGPRGEDKATASATGQSTRIPWPLALTTAASQVGIDTVN